MCLAALAGCRSSPLSELAEIGVGPPLPYAVLVTGGAFVEPGRPVEDPGFFAATFDGEPGAEAFELERVAAVAERGRVFVNVRTDERDPTERRRVADLTEAFPVRDRDLQELLRGARAGGRDLLLVVEKLADGPVVRRGVNGQWPITLGVWLLAGLGVVIPDHTYESQASLHVVLREVWTGRVVHRAVLDARPLNLSLVERSDVLGLLTSIVVPPFLVGDDEEKVRDEVRRVSEERMLVSLARRLKSVDTLARIRRAMPAGIEVRTAESGARVVVEADEGLAAVRLRVDGRPLEGEPAQRAESALLASERLSGDKFAYDAVIGLPRRWRTLQVLLQTVGGRFASVTALRGSSR